MHVSSRMYDHQSFAIVVFMVVASLLAPLCPIKHQVAMMPGGIDLPLCPGERERERERESERGELPLVPGPDERKERAREIELPDLLNNTEEEVSHE